MANAMKNMPHPSRPLKRRLILAALLTALASIAILAAILLIPGAPPATPLASLPLAATALPQEPSAASSAPHAAPPAMMAEAAETETETATETATEEFTDPRALSVAEKAESQKELARMHAALPGNMWLPPLPGQEGPAAPDGPKLSEILPLERKIRKQTATPAQMRQYYGYKLKEVQDRIAIIGYLQKRAEEMTRASGRVYYSAEEINQGVEALGRLELEKKEFEEKLAQAGTDSGEGVR